MSQTIRLLDTYQLTALLNHNRAYCEYRAITGLLLYRPDGQCMHVLEGTEAAIKDLFHNQIAANSRYGSCSVIGEGPWARRSFPDWSMSFQVEETADLVSTDGFVTPDSLGTLLPVLAPTRPALVYQLLEFIGSCCQGDQAWVEHTVSQSQLTG